jgi:hypothetical protein
MRFLPEGPSIPDKLLTARDEGRVVFFCGAGVSRARARLPDFFGLAKDVIETLGVAPDSPAKKIIEEAREIANRVGESGLISADRVFGLLEREFLVTDIHAAVAKSLTPVPDVDLSAHRVMLDLAKGSDGKIRLVTTNFDRLFQLCDNALPCWKPPRLPDPLRDDMNGAIHLHGRVNAEYSGAEGDGFVLSSSEFGRAYLSDAWATDFIRSILDKYLVVFVGYTADDPPVHYLLEALHRSVGSRTEIYAFQSGDESEAQSKWRYKGVQPIAYEDKENHRALWDALTAWSIRARDVEAWYQNTISLARRGPAALLPHERGQMAHVLSTLEGVRRFSSSGDPPPAEWLCVFDPAVRYSKPRRQSSVGEEGPFIDPFALYGLDSDPSPEKIGPEDFASREIPKDGWDCFALTRLDRQDLADQNIAAARGYGSTHVPKLPTRLWWLGLWLGKVSSQPAAVWWAAGQNGIHRDIQEQIRLELERGGQSASPEIGKAWRYIFEAWSTYRNDADYDWFKLKTRVALDGWTSSTIRALALMCKPYLVAERPWGSPRPPENGDNVELLGMVKLNVKYAKQGDMIQLPDKYVLSTVRELRGNLELAVVLERELDRHGLSNVVPIEPDADLGGAAAGRAFGVSALFGIYIDLFRKLLEKDVGAAKREYLAWWIDDETIFARLRIWASGQNQLLSGGDAGDLISELTDSVFWDSGHQRDLLLVLARRWEDFSPASRGKLENRLLNRPAKEGEEEDAANVERRAWTSLNRIHWLQAQGCRFAFDIQAESETLRVLAPRWQPRYSENAASSLEATSGWVKLDKSFDSLLSVPLSNVLNRATEISGEQRGQFIEKDPFAGLASSRPIRALSALTLSGKHGEYPTPAWATFLNSVGPNPDKPRVLALIAERVSGIPEGSFVLLVRPVSEWCFKASPILLTKYPTLFERLWGLLISTLRNRAESGCSSVIRDNKEPDWATEALNSPVGRLAQAVMNDPQKENLKAGTEFPPSWLGRVDELLSMEGDVRRHALVIFAFNLEWFYTIDAAWTEVRLLSAIETEGEDQAAVWAGFFWGARFPGEDLYLRLKPRLLELAKSRSLSRHGHIEELSAFILDGWGHINSETGHGNVTDVELRDVLLNSDEEFRLRILWQLENWSEGDDHWLGQIEKFLIDVWPRQKAVKSPKISARLCEFAFSKPAIFPKIVDIVLSLVTKADGEHLMLHDLSSEENRVVENHPERTLALLSAVLPENTSMWPHGIDEVLEKIGAADAALLKDSRLVELKRRWNAR